MNNMNWLVYQTYIDPKYRPERDLIAAFVQPREATKFAKQQAKQASFGSPLFEVESSDDKKVYESYQANNHDK